MQAGTWPNPPHADEYAVRFDSGRATRLLIVPALFDEGNKLRHFTVEVMRALEAEGLDSMLPDLPGTNESPADLSHQSLETWQEAMGAAARDFSATYVLAIRGGGLCAPSGLPVLRYAPVSGEAILRGIIRARIITDREAGEEVTREELLALGAKDGLTLAGYELGPTMLAGLSEAQAGDSDISQTALGGPGLWLRAEPSHDAAQAVKLAGILVERLS